MNKAKDRHLLIALQKHRDRLLAESGRAVDLYMRSPPFLWGLRFNLTTMNDLRRLLDRVFPGARFVRTTQSKKVARKQTQLSNGSCAPDGTV